MKKRATVTYLQSKIAVDSATGCWNWIGCKNSKGYGLAYRDGKQIRAHRLSAHLFLGLDLSGDLQVLHHCDNPPCCNPEHLFLGTNADNMRDFMRKERRRMKLNAHQVRRIRLMLELETPPTTIATLFNISRGMVWHIISRRMWTHVVLPAAA